VVLRLALNCVGPEGVGLDVALRIASEYEIGWLEIFHERNYTEGEQVADIALRRVGVSAPSRPWKRAARLIVRSSSGPRQAPEAMSSSTFPSGSSQ
jgi:hypothetical protein